MNKRHMKQIKHLSVLLNGTPLSQYKGVFEQYLTWVLNSVDSEGYQAIKRHKSYKDFLIHCISTENYTIPRGKYRHLKPIIRIAQSLHDRGEESLLYLVNTFMRITDICMPDAKFVKSEFQAFRKEFLTPVRPRTMYVPPNFPMSEFQAFMKELTPYIRKEFLNLTGGHLTVKPKESALLLTKNGTVRCLDTDVVDKVNDGSYLPSIVGAPLEAYTISRDHQDLHQAIVNLGILEGSGWGLGKFKLESGTINQSTMNDYKVYLRRNVAFGEKAYKVRIIGVGDYSSQYVLEPLHRTIFKYLYSLNNDYTRDHSEGFKALQHCAEQPQYRDFIACYDLSKATDRFPMAIQYVVLGHIFGTQLANSWRVIMSQPFEGYYYRFGQPMGLLSSWAVFALSHHIMVSFALYKLTKRLITPQKIKKHVYGIVGDDFWITHPALGAQYSNIMNSLGVVINLSKSHVQSDSSRITEFVHRNHLRGQGEITGVSPRLILNAHESYADLFALCQYLDTRHPDYPIEVFVNNILKSVSVSTRSRILCQLGIPSEVGGLNFPSMRSRVPLADPKLILYACMTYSKSYIKYAYKGRYVNNTGRYIVDTLTSWNDAVDFISPPMVNYRQTYEQQDRVNQALLEGKVKNYLTDLVDAYTSYTLLFANDILQHPSYLGLIDTVKEYVDVPFYMSNKVQRLTDKRYFDKFKARYAEFMNYQMANKLNDLLDKFGNSEKAKTKSYYDDVFANLEPLEQPQVACVDSFKNNPTLIRRADINKPTRQSGGKATMDQVNLIRLDKF